MQQTSLKALAQRVLARNSACNSHATTLEKACNKPCNKPPAVVASDLAENIREHFEERSAIREYDGHEPREKAEAEAKNALRVYEYRLSDNPDTWLILLAPGCDLAEAERALKNRFGADRVVAVRAR